MVGSVSVLAKICKEIESETGRYLATTLSMRAPASTRGMRSAWADGADRGEEGETKSHHGAPEQPKGKPGKPITVKLARDPDGHYDGASIPTSR